MDEGVRGCMGKGGCVLIMAGLRWKLETHRKFCMGMCLPEGVAEDHRRMGWKVEDL